MREMVEAVLFRVTLCVFVCMCCCFVFLFFRGKRWGEGGGGGQSWSSSSSLCPPIVVVYLPYGRPFGHFDVVLPVKSCKVLT